MAISSFLDLSHQQMESITMATLTEVNFHQQLERKVENLSSANKQREVVEEQLQKAYLDLGAAEKELEKVCSFIENIDKNMEQARQESITWKAQHNALGVIRMDESSKLRCEVQAANKSRS